MIGNRITEHRTQNRSTTFIYLQKKVANITVFKPPAYKIRSLEKKNNHTGLSRQRLCRMNLAKARSPST